MKDYLIGAGLLDPASQRTLINLQWKSTQNIVTALGAIIINVLIARVYGPQIFGFWVYCTMLHSFLLSVISFGFETILPREFIHKKLSPEKLFGTATTIRFVASVLCCFITCIAHFYWGHEDSEKNILFTLFISSIIFSTAEIVDYYFKSISRIDIPSRTKNYVFIVFFIIKAIAILTSAELKVLVMMHFMEQTVIAGTLIWNYHQAGMRFFRWSLNSRIILDNAKDALFLTLETVSLLVYVRFDLFFLKWIDGAQSLAKYSVAVNMVEFFYFVPMVLASVFYPKLAEKKSLQGNASSALSAFYSIQTWVAIACFLVIGIFGPTLIKMVYGSSYNIGYGWILLLAASLPATFQGVASAQFLVLEKLTRISWYRVLCGMGVHVILCAVLIPKMKIPGAVIASFVSYYVATYSIFFFKPTRQNGMMLLRSFVPWTKAPSS